MVLLFIQAFIHLAFMTGFNNINPQETNKQENSLKVWM